MVGRLIDTLDASGRADNTIIVLWGDHGWHLGDLGIWGKATNYEIAARAPLAVQLGKAAVNQAFETSRDGVFE